MQRTRARGRNLSLESKIRLRDLLAALLVEGMGLSKPDAVSVLSMGAVTENHLRQRLRKCPGNIRDIFRELRQEVAD